MCIPTLLIPLFLLTPIKREQEMRLLFNYMLHNYDYSPTLCKARIHGKWSIYDEEVTVLRVMIPRLLTYL